MKYTEVTRPIGLAAPCAEIERTCSMARAYKRCGLRPEHYIVPLDAGSGRTTLIEYMTDKYKEAGVLSFTGGLDDYIEIAFDGTLPQLKRAFAAIDAAAVYTNAYGGIIGMDVSGLAAHLGETQFAEFLKNCKQVCDHACVIFFVHAMPSRNEEKLLDKLCETVDHVKRLTVAPYTQEELCALIIKITREHGAVVRQEPRFRTALAEMVAELGIASVPDAVSTGEMLVRFADFSDFIPAIDENSLNSVMTELRKDMGRSEVR